MPETWSTRLNYFIRDVARRNQRFDTQIYKERDRLADCCVFIPIFESYQHLCHLHPNQVIDYVNFEWKYYKYYDGRSDLNMERSPDSQSPVTFEDLPVDVLEKVVGKLGILDCLTLRKVNHDLRNLVDSSEVNCESINFHFSDISSAMKLDDLELEYEDTFDGGCMVTSFRKCTRKEKMYNVGRNYQEAMIFDASMFLGNPKLKIGHIGFGMQSAEGVTKILDYLKSLKFPLDARSIKFDGDAVTSILHLFKPERLEEITFEYAKFTLDQFNELAGMEQWKSKTRLLSCEHPKVGIESMVHFKEIDSRKFVLNYNEAILIKIRNVLLKSPHLQTCYLYEYGKDINEDWINERIDRIMGQDPAFDVRTRRFSIPNTHDYFQLELVKDPYCICLNITKVSP